MKIDGFVQEVLEWLMQLHRMAKKARAQLSFIFDLVIRVMSRLASLI